MGQLVIYEAYTGLRTFTAPLIRELDRRGKAKPKVIRPPVPVSAPDSAFEDSINECLHADDVVVSFTRGSFDRISVSRRKVLIPHGVVPGGKYQRRGVPSYDYEIVTSAFIERITQQMYGTPRHGFVRLGTILTDYLGPQCDIDLAPLGRRFLYFPGYDARLRGSFCKDIVSRPDMLTVVHPFMGNDSEFREYAAENEHVVWSNPEGWLSYLQHSKGLITDYSSTIALYLVTGKPIFSVNSWQWSHVFSQQSEWFFRFRAETTYPIDDRTALGVLDFGPGLQWDYKAGVRAEWRDRIFGSTLDQGSLRRTCEFLESLL